MRLAAQRPLSDHDSGITCIIMKYAIMLYEKMASFDLFLKKNGFSNKSDRMKKKFGTFDEVLNRNGILMSRLHCQCA